MSEKKPTEEKGIEDNLSEIEEVAAAKAVTEEPSTAAKSAAPRKSSNKLPLFLLFVSLLTAGYIFAPQPLKDEALTLIETWMQPGQEVQPQERTVSAPETVEPVAPEPAAATEPEAVVENEPAPEVISASSEEVQRMLQAIDQLQRELILLRQQQQAVEATQRSVQRMQLRARLRWIANPANHLAQLQLAWEEISLMPLLSADERRQAESMLALAEKSQHAIRNWQQVLQLQAESLTLTTHDNVVPAFENRWLNWIAEKFSVRPSLSEQESRNAALREQLLGTSRNIEIEQWPDAKSWLQLRATLQLRMVAAAEAEAPALDLPESFDTIKGDIEQLRQVAATWMGELQ